MEDVYWISIITFIILGLIAGARMLWPVVLVAIIRWLFS